MNIYEELKKADNKKSFRELVMKYHPDKKGGDEKIMKKLNDSADKGDRAFEKFREELTGQKASGDYPDEDKDFSDALNKAERKRQEPADFGFKFEKDFVNGFADISKMKEVKGIRSINKHAAMGNMTQKPFWFDLMDGNHIQVEYAETEFNPVIDIWLVGKKGQEMEWKDDKYRNHVKINSAKGAINAIKNIIKNIDTAREREDPYEKYERETRKDVNNRA